VCWVQILNITKKYFRGWIWIWSHCKITTIYICSSTFFLWVWLIGIFGDLTGKQKTCQSLLRAIVSRLGPWFSIIIMEDCSCLQFFLRSFFPLWQFIVIFSSPSCWVYAPFVLFIHSRICIAFCSLLFSDWIFSKENCELAKWSAKFKRKLKRQWQSRLELSLFLLGSSIFILFFT